VFVSSGDIAATEAGEGRTRPYAISQFSARDRPSLRVMAARRIEMSAGAESSVHHSREPHARLRNSETILLTGTPAPSRLKNTKVLLGAAALDACDLRQCPLPAPAAVA